jgi:hypothetical protein
MADDFCDTARGGKTWNATGKHRRVNTHQGKKSRRCASRCLKRVRHRAFCRGKPNARRPSRPITRLWAFSIVAARSAPHSAHPSARSAGRRQNLPLRKYAKWGSCRCGLTGPGAPRSASAVRCESSAKASAIAAIPSCSKWIAIPPWTVAAARRAKKPKAPPNIAPLAPSIDRPISSPTHATASGAAPGSDGRLSMCHGRLVRPCPSAGE